MGQKRRLAPGVTIRKYDSGREVINVTFLYLGKRYREPLPALPVNAGGVKAAANYLGQVNMAIAQGAFRYADFFPDSPRCQQHGLAPSQKTVGEYLHQYLAHAEERKLAYSTLVNYQRAASALGALHDLPARELTHARLKQYVIDNRLTLKTLRNRLSLLRSALDDAVVEGLLLVNPVRGFSPSRYVAVQSDKERDVDPFTPEEIAKILLASRWPAFTQLLRFAFATGMRTSELIGLRWENVLLERRLAHVKEAVVLGQQKAPKTRAGDRYVELDQTAIDALDRMSQISGHQPYVFLDPLTGRMWRTNRIRSPFWVETLERANVRYRKPYQTRHTFATRHISSGKNLWWIAAQMGHESPEMLFRHYGAFIREFEHAQQNSPDTIPKSPSQR